MGRSMNISEAAHAAGVSAKMIRHYEQIGLVPAATRTEAGYRQYLDRDVSTLRFIRQSRQLGFSIEQIAGLLGMWSDQCRTSRQVKALAQGHLDTLEFKMREIAEMQLALKRLVDRCHGDDDPHCAIIEELALTSPVPPEAGAVGAKPARKPSQRTQAAPQEKRPGTATAHVELMAWARGVRVEHAER